MKTFDDFEAYQSSYDTPEDKHAPSVGETIRCKINGQRVRAKVRRIKLVSPRLLREAVEAGDVDPLLVMAAHPIRGLAVWLAEVSPVQPVRSTTPDRMAREDEKHG